jgi:hypothetical protein
VDGSIETYLLLGFALSVIGSVGGIVAVALVLVKLPVDYFGDSAVRKPWLNTHPLDQTQNGHFAHRLALLSKHVAQGESGHVVRRLDPMLDLESKGLSER